MTWVDSRRGWGTSPRRLVLRRTVLTDKPSGARAPSAVQLSHPNALKVGGLSAEPAVVRARVYAGVSHAKEGLRSMYWETFSRLWALSRVNTVPLSTCLRGRQGLPSLALVIWELPLESTETWDRKLLALSGRETELGHYSITTLPSLTFSRMAFRAARSDDAEALPVAADAGCRWRRCSIKSTGPGPSLIYVAFKRVSIGDAQ